MSKVEKLEKQIESLSPEDLSKLRAWFFELDARLWDQQIEADAKAGKLDGLFAEDAEVILTKGDRPVARLVPIQDKPRRQFGSAKGLITIAEDFDAPLEDFKEFTS